MGIIDTVGQGINDLFGIGNSSAREQNQANRDFQEQMSNTAWQRGVADMQKAGINPMLMAGSASASTPSGASGAGGQGGGAVAGLTGKIANSAVNMFSAWAEHQGKNSAKGIAKSIAKSYG